MYLMVPESANQCIGFSKKLNVFENGSSSQKEKKGVSFVQRL
jgi:hypothetical protein